MATLAASCDKNKLGIHLYVKQAINLWLSCIMAICKNKKVFSFLLNVNVLFEIIHI
jgi:hypothetical protein